MLENPYFTSRTHRALSYAWQHPVQTAFAATAAAVSCVGLSWLGGATFGIFAAEILRRAYQEHSLRLASAAVPIAAAGGLMLAAPSNCHSWNMEKAKFLAEDDVILNIAHGDITRGKERPGHAEFDAYSFTSWRETDHVEADAFGRVIAKGKNSFIVRYDDGKEIRCTLPLAQNSCATLTAN